MDQVGGQAAKLLPLLPLASVGCHFLPLQAGADPCTTTPIMAYMAALACLLLCSIALLKLGCRTWARACCTLGTLLLRASKPPLTLPTCTGMWARVAGQWCMDLGRAPHWFLLAIDLLPPPSQPH